MPDCAVGLMAKYPIKGRVKTRLGKDIGNDRALIIYEELLTNAVSTLHSLPDSIFLTSVFIDPPESKEDFKTRYQNISKYYLQHGMDLGMRMQNALAELLSNNMIDKAILIGADIPGINKEIIEEAYQALQINDLVLGPTFDGGYFLIGMKHIHRELFTNIEWSTIRVFEQSIDIAKKNNFKTELLKQLHDIDNLADLKRFDDYYSILKM